MKSNKLVKLAVTFALVASMTLSMFIGVSAKQTDILISNCDSGVGQIWHANSAKIDTAEKTEGKASVSATFPGGNDVLAFQAKKGDKYDLSKATHLAFDLYVSDAKLFNKGFTDCRVEITSGGGADMNSFSWGTDDMAPNGLKKGWNKVYMSFEDCPNPDVGGALNKAKINYFRFFVVSHKAGAPVTVKIDNLRGVIDSEAVVTPPDDDKPSSSASQEKPTDSTSSKSETPSTDSKVDSTISETTQESSMESKKDDLTDGTSKPAGTTSKPDNKKDSSNNTWLIVLIVVLCAIVLIGGGIAGFMFYKSKTSTNKKSDENDIIDSNNSDK